MSPSTISDVMRAYSEDAVVHAKQFGKVLDFTESSLEEVDAILDELVGFEESMVHTPERNQEFWTISKMYGGYVGEVAIRCLGGAWELEDLDNGTARPVLVSCGLRGFPQETIYKCLTKDPFTRTAGYCQLLRAVREYKSSQGKKGLSG